MAKDDPIQIHHRESEGLKDIVLPQELTAIDGSNYAVIRDNPLQRPGMPELLQEQIIGGPEAGRDCRLSVGIEALEMMLDAARHSNTNRCVMHQAGLELRTWRDGNTGHVFQTMTIIGRKPRPEKNLLGESFLGSVTETG